MIEAREVFKRFVKTLDLAAKNAASLGANVRGEVVHAVDRVTVGIAKGEVVGLTIPGVGPIVALSFITMSSTRMRGLSEAK